MAAIIVHPAARLAICTHNTEESGDRRDIG